MPSAEAAHLGAKRVRQRQRQVGKGTVHLVFGLLLLKSDAAIMTFFALPTAFASVVSVWGGLDDVQLWIDLSYSQTPLFSGGDVTTQQ